MIKLALAILATGFVLSDSQLKLEKFEFSSPVEFEYKRHYVESLSNAKKLFDYGTPKGSKIIISSDNLTV